MNDRRPIHVRTPVHPEQSGDPPVSGTVEFSRNPPDDNHFTQEQLSQSLARTRSRYLRQRPSPSPSTLPSYSISSHQRGSKFIGFPRLFPNPIRPALLPVLLDTSSRSHPLGATTFPNLSALRVPPPAHYFSTSVAGSPFVAGEGINCRSHHFYNQRFPTISFR